MDIFNTVFNAIGTYLPAVLAFVGAASVLANLTPTQTDNTIVNFVGKVVNFLAAYWNNPDHPVTTVPTSTPVDPK